ncbi:MAG TPA: CpsD/CapB family tyrosine-protein kinase [Candidatus Angelobacter sp.]|nr:CpsD/CapB family tyrosine-protein kinase [Candidatus Angelobacter sp.]
MSAIQNPVAEPRLVFQNKPLEACNKPVALTVRARQGESRLVFASDPGGFVAEQYRLIRRRLVEQYPDGATILVTSPGSGDGKTVTSTNLAWCLAEAGMPTLLAEMDLRNPSVDNLLGYPLEGPGIEAVLEEGVDPRAVLRQVNRMQFYLATARKPFENPVDLLTSPLLKDFVAWAKENHKWVVLDSPPLLTISDSIELSAVADCTLLVVRARVTPRILVERSVELLGPRLNQVIMNDGTVCSDSSHRYFSSSYPYGPKKKK